MTDQPERTELLSTPHDRLAAAGALATIAPLVQWTLMALGLLSAGAALGTLRPGPVEVLTALVRLGGFALAGWLGGRLLETASGLLELVSANTKALTRIALAVERLSDSTRLNPLPTTDQPQASQAPAPLLNAADAKTLTHAEIRVAIRRGDWDQAEVLIQSFAEVHSDGASVERLSAELAAARQAAIGTLRARIDAARTATDPDRIFELRADLAPLLGPEEMQSLDSDLARWFMNLVQKRLRKGVMTIDVAQLAGRIAEVFDTTTEGASLRASLPTLRRAVGLCARCGQPYTGIANACPACLATSSFPVYVPPSNPSAALPQKGNSNGKGHGQETPPLPSETAPDEDEMIDPELD